MKGSLTMSRKLRMGMVGGGHDSFIGAVHRQAAQLDGQIDFISGALSSTPKKSIESGKSLFLSEDRNYGSWEEMLEHEILLDDDQRIDFVSIVTPNHLHFEVSKAFLKAGIHVICDKPMTYSLAEAKELIKVVKETNKIFALTHNYTGYPLVKQARHLVQNGDLGELLKVVVEYPQGWLLEPLEKENHKQALWRVDPEKAGVSNCIGDIGSHCENLLHYITGLQILEICADLKSIEDRILDNDGNILLHLEKGVSGILHASQFSTGEENDLNIRIYGTKGSISWHQETPNSMWLKSNTSPAQLFLRGNDYLCDAAKRATRLPAGHPESFIEAFANIYMNATDTIRSKILGSVPSELELDFPGVIDGARGMAFIEAVVESNKSDKKWYPMKPY